MPQVLGRDVDFDINYFSNQLVLGIEHLIALIFAQNKDKSKKKRTSIDGSQSKNRNQSGNKNEA